MSLLYRNHLFFKNSCKIFISFPHFQHLLPFSTAIIEKTPPKSDFVVDYLINTCGFSREKAIDASTNLTTIQSPENPDSVLNFLRRSCGFSENQINYVISWRPHFLAANVEKTLVPKIRILRELGLSGSGLAELIVLRPKLLVISAEPFVNFLRQLLGSNEDVIKTLKRNHWGISDRIIEKTVQPNLSYLKMCGVSDELIKKLFMRDPRFFLQNLNRLKDTVNFVERIGLTHQSGMFFYALIVLGSLSNATLEARFELFKSYGWSEADTVSAFVKAPEFVTYSEKKIRNAMDYFVKELEYNPSYVVSYPKLLTYSLEKRIIPRFNVLRILKSKELLKKNLGLYTIVSLSEKKFVEQFLHPHKETAPEIFKAYVGHM